MNPIAFYLKGLSRKEADRHALSIVFEMEKLHLIIDTITFSSIAAVASSVGFSHINPEVTALSFAISAVAIAWLTLSATVKRHQPS